MRRAAKTDANKFDLSTREGRYRARKAGLDVPKQKPGKKPRDFMSLVDKAGACWMWLGQKNADGYGRYNSNRKGHMAHRVMWEMQNGGIPQGKVLMHSCDNPACVNPAHLSIGTHQENQADKVIKRRHAIGSRLGTAKLCEQSVAQIRIDYIAGGLTYRDLAEREGVCVDTIRKVVARVYWRHI